MEYPSFITNQSAVNHGPPSKAQSWKPLPQYCHAYWKKHAIQSATCCDMKLVQIRNQAAPSELAPKCLYGRLSRLEINFANCCIYRLMYPSEITSQSIPLNYNSDASAESNTTSTVLAREALYWLSILASRVPPYVLLNACPLGASDSSHLANDNLTERGLLFLGRHRRTLHFPSSKGPSDRWTTINGPSKFDLVYNPYLWRAIRRVVWFLWPVVRCRYCEDDCLSLTLSILPHSENDSHFGWKISLERPE